MADEGEKVTFGVLGVVAVILLFLLIMGLAGTVDIDTLKAQFHRRAGIACGLLCQFLLMPFIGFLMVSIMQPAEPVAITLMIVCSSSGGAFSNWWCSLFNADLALSIAMTAVSTLVSAVMMPINLTLYVALLKTKASIDIPWATLFQGVGTVAVAVSTGIAISTKWPRFQKRMSLIGNASGIVMILLTLAASVIPKTPKDAGEEKPTPLWAKEGMFYITVAAPFIVSLTASLAISSLPCLHLNKPERVAITVEVCYQNIGIASAVALAAFNDSPAKRADAAAVPVIYGLVEAICLAVFCLVAWKGGWTYAPREERISRIISGNFQPCSPSRRSLDEESMKCPERETTSDTAVFTNGSTTATPSESEVNKGDSDPFVLGPKGTSIGVPADDLGKPPAPAQELV